MVFLEKSSSSKGFTIIELMISTVVFSMVLLVCSYAVVYIGRVYYRGAILSKTQEATRVASGQIARSFNLSNGLAVENSATYLVSGVSMEVRSLCIGMTKYQYIIGVRKGGGAGMSSRIFMRTVIGPGDHNCSPENITTGYYDNADPFGDNMRIVSLSFASPVGSGLRDIRMVVAYGEDADFVGGSPINGCKLVFVGGQFCAVSMVSASVDSRLKV